MEPLFIVIYRYSKSARWQPKTEGCFAERLRAEGFAAALQYINPEWEYAVVEGSVTPEQVAAASTALGAF